MTPQEFREAYLDAQDALGNRLQRLEGFASELAQLTQQLRADYERMNCAVDEFVSTQSVGESSANSD